MLRRLRSFQRGTVGLCGSTGFKVTSCQSWRMILSFGIRIWAALVWLNAVPKAPIWGTAVSGIHPTSCGLVPLCLPSRRSGLQTWASRAPIPGETQLHVELSSAWCPCYEGMRGSSGCAFARYVSSWRRYNPNLQSSEWSCPYAVSH